MCIEGDSGEATPKGNKGMGQVPSVTPFEVHQYENNKINPKPDENQDPEPEASPIPSPVPAPAPAPDVEPESSEDHSAMMPVIMQLEKMSQSLSGRQRIFSEGPKVGLVKDQSKDDEKMNIIGGTNEDENEDDNENVMTYGHVIGQSSGNIQVDEFIIHGDDMDENVDDSEYNANEVNMGNEASDTGITRGFIS